MIRFQAESRPAKRSFKTRPHPQIRNSLICIFFRAVPRMGGVNSRRGNAPKEREREKTRRKREKTPSKRAIEVNSSRSESPLFQRALAKMPLPERRLRPLVVGGREGFELSVPDGFKTGCDEQRSSSVGQLCAVANRWRRRVFGGVPLGIGQAFEMLAFATTILRESLHLGV